MSWKEARWKAFKPQMYVHSDNTKVEGSIEILLSPYILHKVSGADVGFNRQDATKFLPSKALKYIMYYCLEIEIKRFST